MGKARDKGLGLPREREVRSHCRPIEGGGGGNKLEEERGGDFKGKNRGIYRRRGWRRRDLGGSKRGGD